jgi:protein-disulfide isomerase
LNRDTKKKENILKSIVSSSNSISRLVSAAVVGIVLSLSTVVAVAQAPSAAPAAPAPQAPKAPPSLNAAPATPQGPADPLPRANPKFFTASSPNVETVNSFLRQIWGFDSNRVWRVMAIQPTAAPDVTKVVVFVTVKAPDAKIQAATFFVTPDGKHAIGEGVGVVPFGATPFAASRDLLKAHANGASRGAAGKDFELVEFADLQCPHCKEAQSTMDQIAQDFPKAHIVFQPFPLVDTHPSSFKAAAYGVCAQQQSDDAFFKYAAGVFDTQEGLAPSTEDTLLKAAAKRAGLDGDAIAACASTQTTKDTVLADIKLAQDAGVDQTPTLSVNGRMIPIGGSLNYEQLKQLIQYQATLDGVDSGATAETLAPRPAPPTLQALPK